MDHIVDTGIETSLHMEELGSQHGGTRQSGQLERCGNWLSSIPRDDVHALRETLEYNEFLRAFERLGQAHRRVVSSSTNSMSMDDVSHFSPIDVLTSQPDYFSNNFLQHLTADDVILRIFEFLESHSLIRIALTCARFRQLAYRSATQRTYDVAISRQLNSVMQLLRAKEQIEGEVMDVQESHVRVPILLLQKRVIVRNAGDPEYNGVYFCTGSNGNGFVFTKPRQPEQRLRRRSIASMANEEVSSAMVPVPQAQQVAIQQPRGDVVLGAQVGAPPLNPSSHGETESSRPGQRLRCIIAKRFSNETILWYLSKEVEATEPTTTGVREGDVTQVFAFWSKLMVIGDASPDICRYPSQTSILARHREGWRPLASTARVRPPSVELLD